MEIVYTKAMQSYTKYYRILCPVLPMNNPAGCSRDKKTVVGPILHCASTIWPNPNGIRYWNILIIVLLNLIGIVETTASP